MQKWPKIEIRIDIEFIQQSDGIATLKKKYYNKDSNGLHKSQTQKEDKTWHICSSSHFTESMKNVFVSSIGLPTMEYGATYPIDRFHIWHRQTFSILKFVFVYY